MSSLCAVIRDKRVSLRLLEFFVTKYCVVKPVSLSQTKRLLHIDYQSRLKTYSKSYFDPFCRGKRIWMADEQGSEFETTVGQLNFFRFVIEAGIVELVGTHLAEIRCMMEPSCIKDGGKVPNV